MAITPVVVNAAQVTNSSLPTFGMTKPKPILSVPVATFKTSVQLNPLLVGQIYPSKI